GSGNQIAGNFIGTDVTGTAALGNHNAGIAVFGPNTTIGGTTVAERNVISGNSAGIAVLQTTGAKIQGNYIGTNATGTAAIPNSFGGIFVANVSSNTLIGGGFGGNVISGNTGFGVGIGIGGSAVGDNSNTVQGNLIGTQADGFSPLGNGSDGIEIAATTTTVGGPGFSNIIAFNGGKG